MIGLSIRVDEGTVPRFVLEIERQLKDRRGLHAVMASRLSDDLQKHFRSKDAIPNRMGAPKSHFWNQQAADTEVVEVTDSGATVAAGNKDFRLQLFGGTVVPIAARCLTIPLIAGARGRRVKDYELFSGHRLFKVKGHNALFEKDGDGVRTVYALAKSATVKADPTALPPAGELAKGLLEVADEFLKNLPEGGVS